MNILSENDIYFKTMIKHDIKLRPIDINEDFEKNIERNIKNQFEGRCVKEGYIRPGSIKILQRSIGNMNSNQFTGNVEFTILYGAEICNIPKGCVIKVVVKDINKLGILAELGPLVIIIPKDLHENKDLFKKVEIGNQISVFVIGKTYNLNNRRIKVYAKLHTTEINKTVSIKKKNNKNKAFKNEQNIFEEENEEENEEMMEEETELEKIDDEGEDSDFDEEDYEEEEEEMQEPVVEDTTEYQEELEEEGFPNELNEEIVDDVTSEQDDEELDEEITL